MLVLTVKEGESIYIGDDTVVTLIAKLTGEAVLRVDTDQVITIDNNAPKTILPNKTEAFGSN